MRKGHLLNERYLINRKIGSGGMADVYLARDTILERDVAIKALRPEYINDTEFTTRFDREAQAATSLSHPNIVSIYDVGEEEENLYMVMEYIDGLTLKEYIQRYGPLDVEETLDIIKQIVAAITHAHDNDIVHRDIKPQNILMNQFGQAKVTDFGIAIALSATALTQTNSIMGSVHYLSPEQARGGMATKKSDIYSIGIVLYELLTGRLPFSGQSPVSIALKHLQSETPSVRRFNENIPQSVENIVLKATAKDPFHRYDSIYDLEEAVENALDPSRINENPYKPPEESGEETKAIPIITDDQFLGAENEDTIVKQLDNTTKNYAEEKNEEIQDNMGKAKKDKPKKKKWKKWLTTLVIFLVLLLGGLTAFFLIAGIWQPDDVELPDVVDMEYEEAREELENLELVVEEEREFSDEVEEGYVISMSPTAGRTVKEESTVVLSVSEGKERIEMEDYTGRDASQVTTILEELGFIDIMLLESNSDRPVDEILEQIQPNPGQEIIPDETRVIFEVSIGPETINLNNLTGMTEEEVRQYLESNEMEVEINSEYSDTVEPGRVIRQEPSTGTQLERGSTVTVYTSLGPEEVEPRSHTVEYEVEYIEETTDTDEGNGETESEEQIVRIYIGDMNNSISHVYEEIPITEDTEVSFTLIIDQNDEAEYIITRNDEMVESDSISYEDGE